MNSKYTSQQVAAMIASDEPTFIFRAKDALAIHALTAYQNKLAEQEDYEGAQKVREVKDEFIAWQHRNPDKLQNPTV